MLKEILDFCKGVHELLKKREYVPLIMLMVLLLAIGAIYWFLKGNSEPTISVTTEQSNVAVGNTAPVSQTLNVNKESEYVWNNRNSWVGEPGDGAAERGESEKTQVHLFFVANGPVVPVQICLQISSDAKLISAGPIGFYTELGKTKLPAKEHTACFAGLGSSLDFSVYFETKPTKIDAKLVAPRH